MGRRSPSFDNRTAETRRPRSQEIPNANARTPKAAITACAAVVARAKFRSLALPRFALGLAPVKNRIGGFFTGDDPKTNRGIAVLVIRKPPNLNEFRSQEAEKGGPRPPGAGGKRTDRTNRRPEVGGHLSWFPGF
jgi:hypothetical protein